MGIRYVSGLKCRVSVSILNLSNWIFCVRYPRSMLFMVCIRVFWGIFNYLNGYRGYNYPRPDKSRGSVAFVYICLKHGASLYLKFEGLNLSIVIIFKTFHWLKNDESYSVVSVALLCVLLLLRQRKTILCCCETTFLIIVELTYSCFTYQIIISPIPSILDFVYTHFAQKNALNC